ncbi:MAG: hypothetical protein RBT45_03905 [Acholeplasmataceae bacterium]|jgi:hypothetical protein|nr:hypothetical protein [Acholeplasmataceae bacterium]
MKEKAFKKWYELNKLKDEDYRHAVEVLKDYENYLRRNCISDFNTLTLSDLDQLISYLVITNQNTIPNFVSLMRYFKMINKSDHFIHLTKYTGAIGVVESILTKLSKVANPLITKDIIDQIDVPVLGTNLRDITKFTSMFIALLESKLSDHELRLVLADNHHHIPKEAFIQEKIFYEAAPTLEAYLKDLHQRKIAELTHFYKTGQVWYEQEMTQEVIDFVSSNQEIMSAVLLDEALYITKIPYDTKKYLSAQSKEDQSYYLCHCPFAREALRNPSFTISANWCYCSGGFTKFPFDIIFDQDLEIEMLDSALRMDNACRFKIDLKHIDYKK